MKEREGLEVLITKEQIDERIKELASQISEEYKEKNLLVVCVLTGAVIFASDLFRALDLDDAELDTMAISSYDGNRESSGNPRILKDTKLNIENRDVLLVEDIIDTGRSLKRLREILSARNPASLKICCLLSKPSRREVEIPVDYIGFEIENLWVEGYGLDTNEKGRGYTFIGVRN